MVALSDVVASNEHIAATLPPGLVAIFVGGTSGVGEYTVKAFAKYARNPRIYIVGRSEEAAECILKECRRLNDDGKFDFIKSDVSLLKNVDDVCQRIRTKETAINILFMSQGSTGFTKTTTEGLPLTCSLAMHGRMRFILNLLPHLQAAKSLRRVVSVGAASYEGAIDLSNIYGSGFPLHQWRNQMASIQTLLLEEAARRAPDVGFVHDVPGIVKSGIMRDLEPSFRMSITLAVTRLLAPFIETSPEECAERHVFLATSARYAPHQDATAVAGVPLDGHLMVARASNGEPGGGVYTIDLKCDSSSPKVEKLLDEFRKNGKAENLWEAVKSDLVRITGVEAASHAF